MINKIIPVYHIQERRTQPTLRYHYGMVEDCYECDGSKDSAIKCSNSAYNPKTNICEWRTTVKNDLEKIAKNIEPLTFPILKRIVQRKVMEQIKWENGR